MANVTLKISRSDRFPVGTTVKAYPLMSRHFAGPPGAASIAEGTVSAAGLLEITIPEKTPAVLWAEVAGKHRYLQVGDPTPDTVTIGLRNRLRERKQLAGVF